jgi:hypothetical protein
MSIYFLIITSLNSLKIYMIITFKIYEINGDLQANLDFHFKKNYYYQPSQIFQHLSLSIRLWKYYKSRSCRHIYYGPYPWWHVSPTLIFKNMPRGSGGRGQNPLRTWETSETSPNYIGSLDWVSKEVFISIGPLRLSNFPIF